ncbi:MAG: hypothetical protein R3D46_15990 [Defluviimonas denitrificans]
MTKETYQIEGARAAVYAETAPWEGAPTAAIGDFRCDDAEAGAALLRQICAELAGRGVTRVLGPMNGDTWHSYRLVIESDGTPPS